MMFSTTRAVCCCADWAGRWERGGAGGGGEGFPDEGSHGKGLKD